MVSQQHLAAAAAHADDSRAWRWIWVLPLQLAPSMHTFASPSADWSRPGSPSQAVFLLIGKTSALTMNIAGVIKDWMLIFFSFYLFKAPVTTINLLGYAFCCRWVREAGGAH